MLLYSLAEAITVSLVGFFNNQNFTMLPQKKKKKERIGDSSDELPVSPL